MRCIVWVLQSVAVRTTPNLSGLQLQELILAQALWCFRGAAGALLHASVCLGGIPHEERALLMVREGVKELQKQWLLDFLSGSDGNLV